MDAGNSSLCLLSSWVALGCLGDTSKLQIVGNQAAMFPDKGHRVKQCTPVNTKQRSQTFFNRTPLSLMSAVCSVGTSGSVLPAYLLSSAERDWASAVRTETQSFQKRKENCGRKFCLNNHGFLLIPVYSLSLMLFPLSWGTKGGFSDE